MNNWGGWIGLSFLCLIGSVISAENVKVRVKVINTASEILYGVYVTAKHQSVLITTTDERGSCEFEVADMKLQDTIVFSCLGFESRAETIASLLKMKNVVLKGKNILLEEAFAERVKSYFLLKQVTESLRKDKTRNFRFYGNGQYEKITEYQGKVVEYRREYGAYCTGGNVYNKPGLEYLGTIFFIPRYSARSYNLTPDGKDTLTRLYNQPFRLGKPEHFETGARKIFWLLRAIEVEGPLFNSRKVYDFKPIEGEGLDYYYHFSTKRSSYPSRTTLNGNGVLVIDHETRQLKRLSFDYLEVYRWKHYFPVQYHAIVEFAYDSEANLYVKSCELKAIWRPGNDIKAGDVSSRPYPGKNSLVEEEAFACHNFAPIPELLGGRLYYLVQFGSYNPCGEYDPGLFKALPELLDVRKARIDLSVYMCLEEQFRQLGSRPYYPQSFLDESPFIHYPEFNDEKYYERFDESRKLFLEYFFKDL